jgi:hypothetical protein
MLSPVATLSSRHPRAAGYRVAISSFGTKDAFAAMQKNGPLLGVLLTLSARTRYSRT